MDARKKRILWATVQAYVSSAEPVSSRTIARNFDLGVSSATIRNEMLDLEDEGYLVQPHTSAGRIPSIKGYRFYVDSLMEPAALSSEEENRLLEMVGSSRVDEVFRNMARVVATLTQTLSVAVRGGKRASTFNYAKFLPLDDRRAILLVVTAEGQVSNQVVPIPEGSSLDELQFLADRLNGFLHGRDVSSLSENLILSFRKETERDLSRFTGIFAALESAMAPERKVFTGGTAGLMQQPEFRNVDRMQDILKLLEERDILAHVLDTKTDAPITVRIGSENGEKSLSNLSVVRAEFRAGGEVVGTMAVLGPTRMEYARIVGLLYFMQRRLEDLIKGRE